MLWYSIAVAMAIGIFIQFLIGRRRHRRDYREHLGPILQDLGLVFVSAQYPGIFKVGPFPKFEMEWGRPQSYVGGVRGEYSQYRIVILQDAGGRCHQVWAKIEFELFELRRVRWRAESKEGLPPELLTILET